MSSSLPTPSQYANCQFPTPSYQLPVFSASLFSRVAKQQVGPQFGQRKKKKKRDRVMLSLWPNRKSAQMESSQPVSRTFRFAFVCCVTREIPCAQRISHRFDRKSRMRDGRKSGKIADRSPFAALRLTSFRFSLFGIVHRIFWFWFQFSFSFADGTTCFTSEKKKTRKTGENLGKLLVVLSIGAGQQKKLT